MKNIDEHEKLLAQITKLEKNSVNYFDIEKEFFLIDSENLATVKTRLYGYSIQATGIYEEDNLTEEAVKNLDGRGCYVYVEARDGKITIKQDLNGSWGIYLFRHGDYFALSNSFFRLIDHVKYRYPLSINRDYVNYFFVNDLCSHIYSETAVNEISLVERNAILHIDATKAHLEIEFIDYKEHTLSPDSEEGIVALDRWIDFWGTLFRDLSQHTKFISTDLSGGIDSRLSFLTLLHSGADCKKIQIRSLKFKQEDYSIASKIADCYGLKLNVPFPDNQSLNYSLIDLFNINAHYRFTFKKYPELSSLSKKCNKIYNVTGYGGEVIRRYWHMAPLNFIRIQCKRAGVYSPALAKEISSSIEAMIKSAYRAICNKFNIEEPNSANIPQYLYQETRCRHHFGKNMSTKYIENTVMLSPLIDPELRTLRLNTPECPDSNLLIALIFARYEPNLLNFPFDGKSAIKPNTVDYAQKINERFPRRMTADKISREEVFHLQPRDLQVEKILTESKNNPYIPDNFTRDCLREAFYSTRTCGLFSASFNEEFYRYGIHCYESKTAGSTRQMYTVLGIAKILESIEISNCNRPTPQFRLRSLLEQDFYEFQTHN